MKVLVFSPHYDDDVIGCGGSIALHLLRGDEVTIVYVTEGSSGVPEIANRFEASKLRKQEAEAACEAMGGAKALHLNFKDREEWTDPDPQREFVKVLRQYQPTVVYQPYSNDGDAEHRKVAALLKEALWLSQSDYLPELGKPMPRPKLVLGYEVWRPLDHYQLSQDITPVIERKRKAIDCHASQLKHQRWDTACIGLSAYRGLQSSAEYAEVFEVIVLHQPFEE